MLAAENYKTGKIEWYREVKFTSLERQILKDVSDTGAYEDYLTYRGTVLVGSHSKYNEALNNLEQLGLIDVFLLEEEKKAKSRRVPILVKMAARER